MISACVLVRCKAGKIRRVAERVKEIEGVVRVFTAAGRWDVVAEIEAADLKSLTNIALKINKLPNILATETLVEAEM